MNNMMKKILKLIVRVIVVFVVSVIVVNVLAPIFQKDVTDQYKEKIAQTEFQSDQPGTERAYREAWAFDVGEKQHSGQKRS